MRCPSAALALVLGGCSLLYNPGNLPDPSDAHIADADPCALAVIGVEPTSITEGQGVGGSAPALVVLRGENMVNANLKVTLAAVTGAVHLAPITDAVASSDHRFVAFAVTAAIDSALGKDGEVFVPLRITVTQDAAMPGGTCTSEVVRSDLLKLRGLPELTSASRPEVNGKTVTTHDLRKTGYSMVDLMDLVPSVTFANRMSETTSAPALISAVSTIALPAIVADAKDAKAGPGGYEGAQTSGAGPGGGGRGEPAQTIGNGGGGGGAGFANDGTAGQPGTNGGTGGLRGNHTGNDLLVPLDEQLPSAGGVGGAGSLAGGAAGGSGGGGGGVVALFAGGDIMTGTISAIGGRGVDGDGGAGSGGGGGGGAGGVVIVSSDTGTSVVGKVSVTAGPGGSSRGGNSSVGRVRWDALAGSGPSSPDRAAHRGPVFMVPTRIFTTRPQTLTLLGTHDDGFTIRVTDHDHVMHDGGHASFGQDNTALITPLLSPGFNHVCITLDGGTQGHPEADKCIDVAFLP